MQRLTRFLLPALLCLCLMGATGIAIVKTRPAHADAGFPVDITGNWSGSGDYGRSDGPSFDMHLSIQVSADGDVSGTLQEGNSTVTITGSVVMGSYETISFTDPSAINGDGIALNVSYTGVVNPDNPNRIDGIWSYSGTHEGGEFQLTR